MIRRRIAHGILVLCFVIALNGYSKDADTEWHYYGQNAGGTRYSSLDQIHTSNVSKLRRAWTFRTGDIAKGSAHYAECTPLVVDGVMYVITPFSRLIAIDAVAGNELWRFTPDPPLITKETGGGGLASRGVAYWSDGEEMRIFLPVRDGRLYSINTDTHKPDPNFGKEGYINLRDGLRNKGSMVFLSSPPTVYKTFLIQPYGVNDTSSNRAPYVPLRAFDTRTGEEVWRFDTVPRPGEYGNETWINTSWKDRGGCNPWSIISVDEENGIFYVPTGAPNNDKYGGDRHGDNLFGNCILALNAETGERIWHFQTVHHDVWDYDMPAMPNVVDLNIDGETFPAVAVVGKTGFVYIFNRLTGEPLFPIEERPVPSSDIEGEQTSNTQPFPVKPPPFARQRLSEDGLHNLDPEINQELRDRLNQYRSSGVFTPPSKQGTIVYPGQLGGGNWSGAAVSPDGMMYVTANELAYVVNLREADNPFGFAPHARHFRDSNGYPAVAPPWGTLTKIDLIQGELVWQKPLGEFDELSKQGIPPTGQMNFGGGTVTAGGLVFIAASMDGKFRAFDAETGEIVFETQMEAAGYGAPVTYLGKDSKQYVAVFAGGGGKAGTKPGDYVIAFALD